MTFKPQLFTAVLQMKKGAHVHERTKLEGGCNLIARSIQQKVPANVFIVVDTHSEEFTGMLQHSGGKTGAGLATLKEILREYLGPAFIDAMQRSSNAARSAPGKPIGDRTWYDHSASARGGWRGVFLMSCGPAVNAKYHFETLQGLIEE